MDAGPKHESLVSVVVRVCNKEQGRRLLYTSTEGVLDRLGRAYDADITSLGFRRGSFELVLCLEVLEHVPHPLAALAELRRVASRRCLISVPHEPSFRLATFLRGKHLRQWGNHPEHVHSI